MGRTKGKSESPPVEEEKKTVIRLFTGNVATLETGKTQVWDNPDDPGDIRSELVW